MAMHRCANCQSSSTHLDSDDYRLTDKEIQDCISQQTKKKLSDIEFAQTQVRNFAQYQRKSMHEIEIETLPGVILGHKHITTLALSITLVRSRD